MLTQKFINLFKNAFESMTNLTKYKRIFHFGYLQSSMEINKTFLDCVDSKKLYCEN